MADPMGEDAPSGDQAAAGAEDSLSQLVARILNQLSLSAWLPSAALVLLIVFIAALGTSLDKNHRRPAPGTVLADTFSALASIGFGGLLLIAAVIVVMTMLTQAFSFNAIRFFEGYWGANLVLEAVVGYMAKRQRSRFAMFKKRYQFYRMHRGALVVDKARAAKVKGSRGVRLFNESMIEALRLIISGEDDGSAATQLSNDQLEVVHSFLEASNNDIDRCVENINLCLDDYPANRRNIMPTKFGNVLRRDEDIVIAWTDEDPIESFVNRFYDSMPFSTRISHDVQRTRLDLYCSMIFVLLIAAAVAILRFSSAHWTYALIAGGLGVLAAWLTYRAAIASARHYGQVLLQMAQIVALRKAAATARTTEDVPQDRGWRRSLSSFLQSGRL